MVTCSSRKFTIKLLFAIIVAGVGSGFQHGYCIGVVNTPQAVVMKWIKEVYERRTEDTTNNNEHFTFIWELAVSIYSLGGIIGGLTTSYFASNVGRKGGLLVNNLFAIIGGILMGISKSISSPEIFILGRFFSGCNSGLNSGLCSIYLVEISSKSTRGAVGSVYQLNLVLGILTSQILGLKIFLGSKDLWPILFGWTAFVGVLQALLLSLCPETPKYLYTEKGDEQCKKALTWLQGSDIDSAMEEIRSEYDKEQQLGKTTLQQMCKQKVLRRPLIICIVIMLAQQFSGINAAMNYSTEIFMKAGFSTNVAQTATIGIGVMNLFITVISLILVDLAGRKTLLCFGFGSMIIVTLGLTVTLSFIEKAPFLPVLSIILVILFVACFAIGPGSIAWFIVSEVFTQDARPLASSLAVAVNWLANFLISLTFLTIQNCIGFFVFIIFASFQTIFLIFIIKKLPETKNKTYEEISRHFQ